MKINTEQTFMRNIVLVAMGITVALSACKPKEKVTQNQPPAPKVNYEKQLSTELTQAVLWQQNSVEHKMICSLAYAQALTTLENNVKKYATSKKPLAVVLDIDETVLDNSPYEAYLIQNGLTYSSETWNMWVDQANAQLIPGAREFIANAERMGVEVFYISNRSIRTMESTLQNLWMHELSFVDPEHVLLKTETSDKTGRRNLVKSTHRIILSVGDQLADFQSDIYAKYFESSKEPTEFEVSDTIKNHFVLMPNPMYGEFDKIIIPSGADVSSEKKVEYRRKALKPMR